MLLLPGDCLQLMPHLPPQSVDLILCDLHRVRNIDLL